MKDRSERVTLDEVRPSGILKRVDAVSQSFLVPVVSFGRRLGKTPAGDRLHIFDTASKSDAHSGLITALSKAPSTITVICWSAPFCPKFDSNKDFTIGGSSYLILLQNGVQPASLPEVPDKLVECFRVPISNLPKRWAKALNMVPCPQ